MKFYGFGMVWGICLECDGGFLGEFFLVVIIFEEFGIFVIWICYRVKCGWKGSVWVGFLVFLVGVKGNGVFKVVKVMKCLVLKKDYIVESFGLEVV